MTPILLPSDSILLGDLMEDHDRVWRPVVSIEPMPSSPWIFFRIGRSGTRLVMRGEWVLVGRP